MKTIYESESTPKKDGFYLPGEYEVYPGHEGSTSLEYERRFNPYMLRPWDL